MKTTMTKKRAAFATVAGLGIAAISTPAIADHQWATYAWDNGSGDPITAAVVDNTDSRWTSHVTEAVADWNASPHINGAIEYGNNSSCSMVTNTIQVCNDDYGANGWLGLASIAISNGQIIAGSTKLNDTYFDGDAYNNYTWRQLVTCQEIGHDYGLAHQNEDFSTDLTTSCMEYTSRPSGNEHPDAHDYAQLDIMYGDGTGGGDGGGTDGGDGGGTGGGKGKGGGKGGGKGKKRVSLPAVGNTPATWGRPTAFLPNGKPFRFEKSSGNYKFVTHVTWVPGEGGGHGDHDGDHHH